MININQLNFGYSRSKLLFKNLNLQLKTGHIYGLLGKNGAGKSSLLKNFTGLVFPQSGEISVLGFEPSKRHPDLLAQICFIPEEFDLPNIKINTFVKTHAAFYKNFDHDYFYKLIAEFNIPIDNKLIEMSYGQKKKFIISFGLATQARLIIMDEPTNGLDIPSKTQFRKIMAGALNDNNCIVISTHQVRDLDNLIDTVIIIDENVIALNATVEEITKKLTFKKVNNIGPSVIYSEKALGGYHALLPNVLQEDSKLDMELLFNAILSEKAKFKSYFN